MYKDILERNVKIKEYITVNPNESAKFIAQKFDVTNDVVKGLRRTLSGRRTKEYRESLVKPVESPHILQTFDETPQTSFKKTYEEGNTLNHFIEDLDIDNEKFSIKKAFVRKRDNGEKDLFTSYVEIIPKNVLNEEVKDDLNDFYESLKELFTSNKKNKIENVIEIDSDKTLVIYLSDIHAGARVDEDSLYSNRYDEDVMLYRMNKVINKIYTICSETLIKEVVIFNLGDCVDGGYGKTSRGGHELPQNMNLKDQYNAYFKTLKLLFDTITSLNINSKFISVGTSNHAGFDEYIINKSVEVYLNCTYPNIYTQVSEKGIDFVEINNHTIIFLHGKDEMSQKMSFPLHLDNKTELYFTDYIFKKDLLRNSNKILVRKGDLHQYAMTEGKLFDYSSVRSFFGGNHYSSINYGSTKAGVDLEILSGDKNSVVRYSLIF
jgi:hypothetical protein